MHAVSHRKLLEIFEWRTTVQCKVDRCEYLFELLIIEGGFSVPEHHRCQWLSILIFKPRLFGRELGRKFREVSAFLKRNSRPSYHFS